MTNSANNTATTTTQNKAKKLKAGSNKSEILKSKKTKPAFKPKKDIHQLVTDQIISALEKGVKPWACPWEKGGVNHGLPMNYISKKSYSGINIMLLWSATAIKNYDSPYWITYKQAAELGGNVKKGEKSTLITFYTNYTKKDKATGEENTFPVLKTYNVFNAEQIENVNFTSTAKPIINDNIELIEDIENVEHFIHQTGAIINHHGEGAFYSPNADKIVMPEKARFKNSSDYYATLLHELTHWTGHKSRMARDLKNSFGSKDYAFEELIAELGSAFLLCDLNVSGEVQHADYIASWLKKLNDDKRFIFKAASAASKAHQFLLEAKNTHAKAA